MKFYPKELDDYVVAHTKPEHEILRDLNRETHSKVLTPQMLSGHYQGILLSLFSKMIQPDRILEIGTYTGYSAICLAAGLSKNGLLHTIDINEELKEISHRYFKKMQLEEKIRVHVGDALKIIPELDEKFDLVFIDADKINYSNYYDLVFDKLNPGGYIIADNVLWSGKVLEADKDADTAALDAFNQKIVSDLRVENILLPVRDGLMVARKNER